MIDRALFPGGTANLTIASYPGELATITGAKHIAGFRPDAGAVAYFVDLPPGVPKVEEVIFRDQFMTNARWPKAVPGNWKEGFANVVSTQGLDANSTYFTIAAGRSYARPEDGHLFFYNGYDWGNTRFAVKQYDTTTGRVVTDASANPATAPAYAIQTGNRYFVQNMREDLTDPGEWYFDRSTSRLYVIPPAGVTDLAVDVPVTPQLVTVDGVSAVTITGLKLQGSLLDTIMLTKAGDIHVTKNVFRATACYESYAAVHADHIHDSSFAGNDFAHIGTAAFDVTDSGDLESLTPANVSIANNYIHHIGEIANGRSPINVTDIVGATVAHNYIHDTARGGIWLQGANVTAEYNRFRHTSLLTGDTGTIHTGADNFFSSRGTKIQYNLIEQSRGYYLGTYGRGAVGIYLDNESSGLDVVGNVIFRATWAGIFVHGGRDNLIRHNLVLDGGVRQIWFSMGSSNEVDSPLMSSDALYAHYQASATWPVWQQMRGVETLHPPAAASGPTLTGINNVSTRNLLGRSSEASPFYDAASLAAFGTQIGGDFLFGGDFNLDAYLATPDPGTYASDQLFSFAGYTQSSFAVSPAFVSYGDSFTGDYRVVSTGPESEVAPDVDRAMGAGLFASPERATWPIEEEPGAREAGI